jgi:biotin transport system substrate-specific component
LLAALNCVCAWIAVPVGDISITLQTFSVMLTLELLGGKWGTVTTGVYLLLGSVGMPVFSGFRGGLGAILGATGGYLLGFIPMGIVFGAVTALFGKKARFAAGLMGLTACYAAGTAWYMAFYLQGSGLAAVLLKCVVPYLIPDVIKIYAAFSLADRLRRRNIVFLGRGI